MSTRYDDAELLSLLSISRRRTTWRHLRRRLRIHRNSWQKSVAGCGIFFFAITVFWALGLSDFLFEKSFDDFVWPPYVDVREQVVRQILGKPAEFRFVNNWLDFVPVLEPTCSPITRRRWLHIIVKTAPHRVANRDAIRATIGKIRQLGKFKIRTIFVLGMLTPHDHKIYGDILPAEQRQFDDLLVGDFIDHYRNNTYKLLYALRYTQNYCMSGSVPYVFLVDDDYLISLPNLLVEVEKHPPNERMYLGWRFDTSPFRLTFQKHRVSLSEYPYAAYPPYISAGAVLLTGQTVREFYLAVQHTKLFRMDDVYTGILAYFLGISPQHSDLFHFWSTTKNANPMDDFLGKTIAIHGFSSREILKWSPLINRNLSMDDTATSGGVAL